MKFAKEILSVIGEWKKEVTQRIRSGWKYYRPSIFDRYILRQYVLVSVFALFFIVVLYEVVQVFQFLRWFPEGTKGWDIFVMNLHEGTYWAMIFLPLALSLGAVVVFTRLANHHELRAMVSTGISLRRVMLYPLLVTAMLVLCIVFFFQEQVIFPLYQRYFAYKKRVFERVSLENIDHFKDNQNVVVYGPNHTLYMGERYYALAKKLENVVILLLLPPKTSPSEAPLAVTNEYLLSNLQMIEQERSLEVLRQVNFRMRIDAKAMVWDKGSWVLYDGLLWTIDPKTLTVKTERFSSFSTNILSIEPYYLERIWYDVNALRPSQLAALIRLRKKSGQFYADLEAVYFSNISYVLNAFFLVLLLVGLVDISKKKVSLIEHLVICFVSFALFYVIFAMGASFAANGDLPSLLGGFLGTLLLAPVSLGFYKRLRT
ncbi:MAG: LptF/LptG family permease [Brevinematales bacterium]|nr:LptF/LptG family permease [Brevinematales bacterium]